MSVDQIFVIALIALSVLVVAIGALRSRGQGASAASVDADGTVVPSGFDDGAKP